jgi:hypothetical protein
VSTLARIVILAVLVGACSAAPEPPPADPRLDFAPPPPPVVSQNLAEQARLTFRPPTTIELRTVTVTADQARLTALSVGPQPYGEQGRVVVWTKVGCEFLGWLQEPQMPNHGQPATPRAYTAYLVQLLGDPVPGWPGINVELVVVDAVTGERGMSMGGGPTAFMGSTCGITP